MNKLVTSLVIIFSLCGCVYQKADITDIKKAQQQCEGRGGIKYISIYFHGGDQVFCVDGPSEILNSVVLREYHGQTTN